MDALLRREEAVGVLAAGDEGGRLDPGLFPRRGLLQLHLHPAPLGPAHDHAEEHLRPVLGVGPAGASVDRHHGVARVVSPRRSEEHTSELQSHSDLVCRLLLEKKKKNKNHTLTNKKKKTPENKK